MSTSAKTKPLTELQVEELQRLESKPNKTERQLGLINDLKEKERLSNDESLLSAACMSEVRRVYAEEKYKKFPVLTWKEHSITLMNGMHNEPVSLEMLGKLDGVKYNTYKKLIQNKHIKGMVDAFSGKSIRKATKIVDIKTASSMQSLVLSIGTNELDKYYWQIMGYLAITGCEVGEIVHCLVSYPTFIVNQEISKFIAKAVSNGMESEYIDMSIEKIKFNMTFDDIPVEERVVRYTVVRDEEKIRFMYDKVATFRGKLEEFSQIHKSLNNHG